MNFPTTLSECHALLTAQQEQLAAQSVQIAYLVAKVAELEARLNKNSGNSDQPPSSDGLSKKPAIRPAFERKKGRKSGGQPGHKGKTLEISATPDHTQSHLPSHCECGQALDKSAARVLAIRQVFDLPDPKLEITEHQQLGCACHECGRYHQGTFPASVVARTQYGSGVKAMVVLLNTWFKLPLKKIQTLFGDFYGYGINESTIVKATGLCYDQLEASEEGIKKSLLKSVAAHFDETGMRVVGKLHWLHACCTTLFTYLFIHAKRGTEALEDRASILPNFKQWAIHDCWTSYFKFTDCSHGICGAHVLRELKALEEQKVEWASWFRKYLLSLYRMSGQGKGRIPAEKKQKALRLFERIWSDADEMEPQPVKSKSGRGRPKGTKGRNLLIRFKKHQSALLAFAFEAHVPFTNNQAERDLRPAKTKQKVAGSFRALEGAKRFARIQGFVSTTRKHQLNVFQQLKRAFEGQTFLTDQNTG